MAVDTMGARAQSDTRSMTANERMVIFASSLGTVFEWYDFYLYAVLALIISGQFFSVYPDGTPIPKATADIFALLAFAAAFLVRPFGALVFGRVGDLVGRKYTFLITILIMGLSTFLVGVLPNSATIGIWAPIGLLALRLMQGLALGGEYGGAATYVAEHAPQGRRGFYTSWIQTTATLGLFMALGVILTTRTLVGEKDFAAFYWRVPFLLSFFLLLISLWIRLQLAESPAFQKMKDEGTGSSRPWAESFGNWGNFKIVSIALFGLVMGQAVVWYAGQFYALYFLSGVLKVDGFTSNALMLWALALGTFFFVVFGWLSDKIGRKPIILAGCLLAVLTYFPLFTLLAKTANPKLANAVENIDVRVVADPRDCGSLFNPVGTRVFTSSCDLARAYLASQSVRYSQPGAEAGKTSSIKIGDKVIEGYVGSSPPDAATKAAAAAFAKNVNEALWAAGYPKAGDPDIVKMNGFFDIARPQVATIIGVLFVLLLYVTMVYGPIAAALVELFPTRIRYTSMSLPYHIGNGWFGGFLPAISLAMVAASGDIYFGLWYPIGVAAVCFVLGLFLMPETFQRDIYAEDHTKH